MAILDTIKYNGSNHVFAWKYPKEQLYTGSQLIVGESQEAVLVKNGEIYDVFGCGRYTLDISTIPLLSKVLNLSFGGRSPFTTEIWFINKAFNLDIKWGTPSPIQIQDSKYKIFVPVRSHGVFGIQIEDSLAFLTKLVGTMEVFDTASITQYFRGLYVTRVKDAISSYLIKNEISVLEVNAYLDEISDYMKKRIEPTMNEYGIKLISFYVNEISVPEDDPTVENIKKALSKKAEMDIIGNSNTQNRSLKNDFTDIASIRKCPECGTEMSESQRFCGYCGFDTDKAEKNVLKCLACGHEISKNDIYCPQCGRKINPCPEFGDD